MSFALSRSECQKLLAETHVGVISVADEGRGPITTPIWYTYRPGGDIVIATLETTRKIAPLRRAGRASFCVQDERPPFRYVSVEGPVRIETGDTTTLMREAATRYVGAKRAETYMRLTAGDRAHEVIVRITPERWYSAQYAELFTE
jgi:PPOX class probable F420-dependent enzyme